jgi:TRAP-type C4-dicarboxylate transport system substrate-binding protein
MSKRRYDSLTPDQQRAVRKAGRKAVVAARRLNTQNTKYLIAKLKEKGMKVNEVRDPKAFRAKVNPVYEEFRPTIGSKMLDGVLAEVE